MHKIKEDKRSSKHDEDERGAREGLGLGRRRRRRRKSSGRD